MSEYIEQIACLSSHTQRVCNLRQEAVQKQTAIKQDIAYKQIENGSFLTADMPDAEMQQALARGTSSEENAEQNGVEEHLCHKERGRKAETEKHIDSNQFEEAIDTKDNIGVNKQGGDTPDDGKAGTFAVSLFRQRFDSFCQRHELAHQHVTKHGAGKITDQVVNVKTAVGLAE